MAAPDKTKRSYCRDCEREQHHSVLSSIDRPWDDEENGFWGGDIWETFEAGRGGALRRLAGCSVAAEMRATLETKPLQREGDTRRILLEWEVAQRRRKTRPPGITKAHATGA